MHVPRPRLFHLFLLVCIALLVAMPVGAAGAKSPIAKKIGNADRMSAMGQLAARARRVIEKATGNHLVAKGLEDGGCINEPDCGNDEGEGDGDEGENTDPDSQDFVVGGQAEVSIAVDSTGQHVVIGFNDTRGFALNPVSVSGYLYSDDGGVTFVDGGQLPSPGTDVIGTTRLPQVFGDPEIKYMGGCNFIYASIVIAKFSATRAVQTMGVHRSTDCGHTWTGPFVIGPATNPHGMVNPSTGAPRDSADKEFLGVDPDTGRVMLSWSNFTPFSLGGVEISTTYSDDVLTGNPPTWSPRAIAAAQSQDGQSSIPRFAGNGSPNAYVTWRRFPFPGTFFGYGNTIGFARSTDNGATWSAPVDLGPEFFTVDSILGNDRINTSPSLDVDNSSGNVYVVYADNDNHDGADIVFQRSTDGGLTFSAPQSINSRPGGDRSQWFPWVTVDQTTHRVWVFYYDQGIATSGDRSETTVTFSDDGGLHWSAPVPLTDRPFHAGWGNDTGQPNLGDYSEAVAQGGELFAAYALASRPPLGFVDGQPDSGSMTVPDVSFRRVPQNHPGVADDVHPVHPASRQIPTAPLHIVSVAASDSGGNGFVDAGETVNLQVTLRNYVTNSLSAALVNGATATLSTTTPGVTVTQDQSPYPNLGPGATSTNKKDFVLALAPSFVPGTPIELALTVRASGQREVTLLHTLFTGTPVATTLLSENFNSVAPGALPAGWTTSHAGGANVVPWTTKSTFCGTGSNGAFHQNANDGVGGTGSPVRFERLFSPVVTIPSGAEYVTLDFDICYDTEDDPNLNILAYDGALLRITDLTPGRLLRSELVEAFEDEFSTGNLQHFPKQFPRSSNANYFQDMSAWAGDSQGVQHVHMRLPGMAGSTIQLRFEYTQDSAGICSDVRPGHTCGVLIDNIVLKSAVSAP
jgi:hypothetical protein